LNWDIVDEMSEVKVLVLRPDGIVADEADEAAEDAADDAADDAAEDAGVDDDVDVDDEQPAAIRAVPAATAAQPRTGRCLRPRPLLPSCIPYPFHRNAVRSYTPMRDTAHHVCPYALKGRSRDH
jgi:hypothetical protein